MTLRGFWQAAEAEPERVALVDAGGRELSAGALSTATNRLVHGLRARGLANADCIATLMPNCPELVSSLLAAMQAGWHYTPLNTHLTPPEIVYILADSRAGVFLAHERCAEVAVAAADAAGVPADRRFSVGSIPGFETISSLCEGQSAARPEDRLAGQFMQYTSGTTGKPKAVRRAIPAFDPDEMIAMLAPNLSRFDIEPGGDHVHLVTSPMYHMAPLSFCYFSLHFEHRVVLMDGWDAEGALDRIERYRVTTTHMVPTQFHRLRLLPEEVRRRADVSSLRHVMHAAAPCPVDLKRAMLDWWGPVIYEYYGATEGGGTLARPAEWLARPGTVGRPWPGADIKIFDEAGAECSTGEVGTVYLKLMMDFEYKDDPEKTRSNRRGEYFTVGDVGTLDEDGWLFLRDRKIDMIISGGVNVYPAEIEAVLLSHPEVGDAAVFGIPHEGWGEEVKAAVEPVIGVVANAAFERRLLDHCAASLAKFKCPRSIDFHGALPRDPNGKLYKRRLRDPYWEGRVRAI